MSVLDRIRDAFPQRRSALLEPGERAPLTVPRAANETGLREFADAAGWPYQDAAVVRDAYDPWEDRG